MVGHKVEAGRHKQKGAYKKHLKLWYQGNPDELKIKVQQEVKGLKTGVYRETLEFVIS